MTRPPRLGTALLAGVLTAACAREPVGDRPRAQDFDSTAVTAEVEAAVWAFHAADTARSPESVIALLWPEFSMLGDGARVSYEQVVAGSREFMAGLELFHTEWSELEVLPLRRDLAVSSFVFRDSIVTRSGDLILARGPTTWVWERRDGEWRIVFGDSDHYPLTP